MVSQRYEFDVAVSFAGAQRDYVERFVEACDELGMTVFYDRRMTVRLWGRNLIHEFREVYGGERARYVVAFISADYLNGSYPLDELTAAVEQGLHRRDGYVLPVTMGAVTIPRTLLSPAIGYLSADDLTPVEVAESLRERLGMAGSTAPGSARPPAPEPASPPSRPRAEGDGATDAERLPHGADSDPDAATGFLRSSPSTRGPVAHTGTGNRVLTIAKPESGPVLMTTTNEGSDQLFTVYALDAGLADGDLLVNAIGSYTGRSILDSDGAIETQRLRISGGGTWQIVLEPLTAARTMTTAIAGTGDDVIWYRGPLGVATVSNEGPDELFTVYFYGGDGEELLVNEIGSYEGETTIKQGPAFLEIDGGGSWSIKVDP